MKQSKETQIEKLKEHIVTHSFLFLEEWNKENPNGKLLLFLNYLINDAEKELNSLNNNNNNNKNICV